MRPDDIERKRALATKIAPSFSFPLDDVLKLIVYVGEDEPWLRRVLGHAQAKACGLLEAAEAMKHWRLGLPESG